MTVEHEIKLIGINEHEIKRFLKSHNIKINDLLNYKRVVFDTVPFDENAWIRLRTDGKNTTLTYKKSIKDSIDGMQEIEIEVNNFRETKRLLELSGLKSRNYQENKREVYCGFDCMITIDFWPLIPAYVEIEGDSVAKVKECLEKFKGLYKSTTSNSTEEVYQAQGINLREIDKLTFDKKQIDKTGVGW